MQSTASLPDGVSVVSSGQVLPDVEPEEPAAADSPSRGCVSLSVSATA